MSVSDSSSLCAHAKTSPAAVEGRGRRLRAEVTFATIVRRAAYGLPSRLPP